MIEDLVIALGDLPKSGETFIALSGKREDIIEMLEAVNSLQEVRNLPDRGFTITMPCGYEQIFKESSDIPTEDLSCPCGKEFLIKLN